MSFTHIDKHGNRIVTLEAETENVCVLCKTVAELRPYGPKFQRICFKCAMKDRDGTERRMGLILYGEGSD